ncbi:hypothetical protein [Macrococcus capreoli]|uniref:hypothetical protein n=1 Tax=Macrococcus capreoli TaxID=2982690 RepID=UPI003F4442B4
MAGYIFSVNKETSVYEVIEKGYYSTKLKITSNKWGTHHEGTIADYLSMKEGDNVYFFQNRKIYGIGTLKKIKLDVKLKNFPDSDIPEISFNNVSQSEMVIDLEKDESAFSQRFLCTFIGGPEFFLDGVDMDEVLISNPNAFKILRSFEKLSFIKIDDIENKALFDMILNANKKNYLNKKNVIKINKNVHSRIKAIVNEDYILSSENVLKLALDKKNKLAHEMALEAHIIDLISNEYDTIFGKWDYISHQVIASPFKPIVYVDKIDIFGYKYLKPYNTISDYLMIEIKKGAAGVEVINQAMKYIDWIQKEYSHDYSMIQAFIVAESFDKEVIDLRNQYAKRYFTVGRSPTVTKEWNNLKLIEYRIINNQVQFKEIIEPKNS